MGAYKTWLIDYSIKFVDGTINETWPSDDGELERPRIKARTIQGALKLAQENIVKPMLKQPDVSEVIIWGILLVENDVFGND